MSACFCLGPDQRITSGPAAIAAASRWRQASRRKQAEYMTAPERFAEKSDSLLHRGRRPYMTHHVISQPSIAALRKVYSMAWSASNCMELDSLKALNPNRSIREADIRPIHQAWMTRRSRLSRCERAVCL